MKKLAILNTSILTSEGTFTLRSITLTDAKKLVQENEILSAVGHQSTAEILTELLEIEIPMNRIQFGQEQGQQALVFKLNGRAPEGKIMSREEIEAIGYKFQLLERTDKTEMKMNEYLELTSLHKVQNYSSGFKIEASNINEIQNIGNLIVKYDLSEGNEIAIYEKGEEFILVGEHLEKFYGVRINKNTWDILS